MKPDRIVKAGLLALLTSTFIASAAYADRDDWNDHGGGQRYSQGRGPAPSEHFRLDDRYRHDHYYPRRGYVVHDLPPPYHRVHYRDQDFFFYGGVWYRPYGRRYVVVAPPVGVVIPTLPAFYTTLWIGGIPYYYANDTYYVWRPDREGYLVTEPPAGVTEHEPAPVSEELFIYPKQGQSEQKQADDRYACHRWSVTQTNFDPTLPPENGDTGDKREDYQRAMRACLEGRGYSVR